MRWLAVACVVLLLAACATVRAPVGVKGTPAMLAAQADREAALAARHDWSLEAHLGVSSANRGGSGTLTWRHDGDHFDFTVRAPITGRSFRLSGGPDDVTLEGLDQGTVRGRDASALLRRVLGWNVPVGALRDWVRGMRAPAGFGSASLRFGTDGLPSRLQQAGWTVEYLDWYTDRPVPLPRKVFASHGDYRVRLSISHWTLQ